MSNHNLNIGQKITTTQQRDAIHVAVMPVVLRERIYQGGEHVGVLGDGTAARGAKHIGIIDPFLKDGAEAGDTVWLFLYPGTITSLSHAWTHTDLDGIGCRDPENVSSRWLQEFCATHDCPNYDELIAVALSLKRDDNGDPNELSFVGEPPDGWDSPHRLDKEYFHFTGIDAHSQIPPEFWTHLQIVTGKKFLCQPSSFSCSC